MSARLKEGRAQFSYYREVFEMAKMIYNGYYEFIDEALVVDAFRFLYQLGIRSEALFRRMYRFSQHLGSGDLTALCGVMAEEGLVSKALRESISNAESSKELARRFYKRAQDEGSALGHVLLLTLNAKNGNAGSLEDLRKLADKDNIYAKYMYNEARAWNMTDKTLKRRQQYIGLNKTLRLDPFVEVLPEFIELHSYFEDDEEELLQLVEHTMRENYLPFFMLSDYALDLQDHGDEVAAMVIWKYLSDIGYAQCSMSVVESYTHLKKYGEMKSEEIRFLLLLIERVNETKSTWVRGWPDREYGRIQLYLNNTDEALVHYRLAANKSDINSLIELTVRYQYGVLVPANVTQSKEFLSRLSKVSRVGLSSVLLSVNMYLDEWMDFFILHWVEAASVCLFLVGCKFYVRHKAFH